MSLSDADSAAGPGVASQTRGEISIARAALDRGELCVIGLIRAQSADPRYLGRNHQVLAYGYELDEATRQVTLYLYDPNHPDSEITLSCSTTTGASLELKYSSGEPTRGFFVFPYSHADPAPLFGGSPTRSAWVVSIARVFSPFFGARA